MKAGNFVVVGLVALAACGEQAGRIVSVETLVQDPERLRELRAACKADHAKVGDAQCNAVAEATRRRFMGEGTRAATPYGTASAPVSGTARD